MNILFLSCWYPSEENLLKGVFVKAHAHAIHLSGEKIIVLALDVSRGNDFYEKRIEKFTDEQGVETHIIHIRSLFYKWIYINPFHLYSVLRNYFEKEILPSFNPDVIHSNILNPCAMVGDWLASNYKKPHVITEHWSKIDNYMCKNIFSFYGRRCYENARAITVVSEFLKSIVAKYVSHPSKIKIISNVIDATAFSFAPKNSSSKKIIFTCAASWKPPKLPALFVLALEKIDSSSPKDIELNFIGEGPQLDEIKKMQLSYSVIYHGTISKLKIAELLHRSNYFLHASRVETFSMVCAEALATGTPVIASKVGALPELINDSNGVLAENTVEAWTTAIQIAMAASYNHHAISSNWSERFSREAISKLFSGVYRNI